MPKEHAMCMVLNSKLGGQNKHGEYLCPPYLCPPTIFEVVPAICNVTIRPKPQIRDPQVKDLYHGEQALPPDRRIGELAVNYAEPLEVSRSQ